MKLVVREFQASDRDAVCDLFSVGIKEHIGPCFSNAMRSREHLLITSALCAAGLLLGSWLWAVLLPGLWVIVVYSCCYELYAGYVRSRLGSDMQDISSSFMRRPGDCFWVAEAEVEGGVHLLGTVAVVEREEGAQRFGELFRMIISPTCRRMGLGLRLTQTVVDFCKDRGCSKVLLETSSTQRAAVALYHRVGFRTVLEHKRAPAGFFITHISQVTVLQMEMYI